MLQLLAIAETLGRGLIHAGDLDQLGLNSRQLAHAVTNGLVIRVARGVYARPPQNREFTRRELHELRVRAAVATYPRDAVVSHLSAAAMHGLPLIGPWPPQVHMSMADARSGSSSAGIVRHIPAVASDETILHGVRVTSIARTLVDIAATQSLLIAVTMIDHALRHALVDKACLVDELRHAGFRTGNRRASQGIAFADGRSGSPGESLTRVQAWQLNFEEPDLQVHVSTLRGEYDVDFGWESCRLFGEFDGKVKYTRSEFLRGRSLEQVILEEKAREDAIRARTDRSFLRILWSEAYVPRTLDAMLRSAGVPRRGRVL